MHPVQRQTSPNSLNVQSLNEKLPTPVLASSAAAVIKGSLYKNVFIWSLHLLSWKSPCPLSWGAWQRAGRHGVGAAAERLHPEPHAGDRGELAENGGSIETSKPSPSDTFPQQGHAPLILPRQFSIQMPET